MEDVDSSLCHSQSVPPLYMISYSDIYAEVQEEFAKCDSFQKWGFPLDSIMTTTPDSLLLPSPQYWHRSHLARSESPSVTTS